MSTHEHDQDFNKVFCIGAHRTATKSLSDALNKLGISCNHWKAHDELYNGFINKTYELDVLNDYDALADLPVSSLYQELDQAYPQSKFIFTTRNIEDWLSSTETWCGDRVLTKEEQLFYGTEYYDRDVARTVFETHESAVMAYFSDRPNDLLVMDIPAGDGWSSLCAFLHKDIPEEPFPVTIKKHLKKHKKKKNKNKKKQQ